MKTNDNKNISLYSESQLCYLVFKLKQMSKIHNENNISFFPIAGLQQLMVRHVSKTLNAWILFCKTWMTTENCYYKILPKAKSITSSFFVTFSAKIRTTSGHLYWTWRQVSFCHFNPTWSHIPKKTQIRDSLNSILVKKDRNYVITNFMTLRMTN